MCVIRILRNLGELLRKLKNVAFMCHIIIKSFIIFNSSLRN